MDLRRAPADGGACRRARRSPLAHRGQDSREWHVLGLLRRGLRTRARRKRLHLRSGRGAPRSPLATARVGASGWLAATPYGDLVAEREVAPLPDDGRTRADPVRQVRDAATGSVVPSRASSASRWPSALLIAIAHPDFREALEREAREKNVDSQETLLARIHSDRDAGGSRRTERIHCAVCIVDSDESCWRRVCSRLRRPRTRTPATSFPRRASTPRSSSWPTGRTCPPAMRGRTSTSKTTCPPARWPTTRPSRALKLAKRSEIEPMPPGHAGHDLSVLGLAIHAVAAAGRRLCAAHAPMAGLLSLGCDRRLYVRFLGRGPRMDLLLGHGASTSSARTARASGSSRSGLPRAARSRSTSTRRSYPSQTEAPAPSPPQRASQPFADGAGRRVEMARGDTARRPASRARARAAPR